MNPWINRYRWKPAPDVGNSVAARFRRLRTGITALLACCVLALPLAGAEKDAQPKEFSIVNARLLDSLDGYPVPMDSIFFPGETVHLVFNIAGFTVDDEYRLKLKYTVQTLGAAGVPFSVPEGGEIATELAPQDEKWLPIVRSSPELPAYAESGTYKFILKATDELGNKRTEKTIEFNVSGANVQPGEDLVIRNVRFSRSEGGETLPDPVFLAGEPVWGSFYITGYRIGEDNRYSIESDMKVLGKDGKVMYSFDPVREMGSPFYPRMWVPATFRLDLDKDIPSGEYTILLTVHDSLSDQKTETTRPFAVR